MLTKTKPQGKLAVLMPGVGGVATTLMAGVEMIKAGKGLPIGSVTQMGTARIGRRDEHKYVKIKDLVPLAGIEDLVFGTWDISSETGDQVADRAKVLRKPHLDAVRPFLKTIKPKKGVHDAELVRNLKADNIKTEKTARDKIDALRQDIKDFKTELGAKRAVMIFCASTEGWRGNTLPPTWKDFAKLVDQNDAAIRLHQNKRNKEALLHGKPPGSGTRQRPRLAGSW